MKTIYLYTTLGCHLCEIAESMVQSRKEAFAIDLVPVEISDDDALVEQYGVSIPVLKKAENEEELGWPFDHEQLSAFLSS